MTRPFRFAVQAYRSTSAQEWREVAQRTEALGYSTLNVADHYIGAGPRLDGTGHRVQTLAAIPAMAYAAAVTSTVRIGSRMLNVGYHLPAVLAKEVATIDVLSGGRLELGIGAGWLVNEYEAMGIPFGTPGERITLLEESIELITQACAGRMVDVAGTFVNAGGYTGVPATVQTPRPPIMIGGGAPRILRYAGRVADIVSINFNNRSGQVGSDSIATSTAEETANKIASVTEGAAGRDRLPELEIATYFLSVTGRSESTAESVSARTGLPMEELVRFPHALVGEVPEIVEELQRRREVYGFSYVTVGDANMEAFAPVVEALAGT
jgi:probable F420-dependent oxidoreductase